VKQILDRMMTDRRLGRNLKGMNKSNLNEIENGIWSIVEREAALYLNHLDYTRQKEQLWQDLRRRKVELQDEIVKLGCGRESRNSLMLTENLND
jgi:hypothetical protein